MTPSIISSRPSMGRHTYRLIEESTTRVPQYSKKTILDNKGNLVGCTTKETTGQFKDVTHKFWRCSCGAWYCGETAPKDCGNKKCPEPMRTLARSKR